MDTDSQGSQGIAVIGGTGVDDLPVFASGSNTTVSTRFGSIEVRICEVAGEQVYFLPRHGPGHEIPPHLIDHRANIAGLKSLGVRRVLGLCTAGSLRTELSVGQLAILTDFIDHTRGIATFFDGTGSSPVVHTDFTHPYCPCLSEVLRRACLKSAGNFVPESTYVGVSGPRYETPAEVRMASWGGDLVGMTNVPECILAKEAGLCYCALALVTNPGAGLSPEPLSHEEVVSSARTVAGKVTAVVTRFLETLPKVSNCRCAENSALEI